MSDDWWKLKLSRPPLCKQCQIKKISIKKQYQHKLDNTFTDTDLSIIGQYQLSDIPVGLYLYIVYISGVYTYLCPYMHILNKKKHLSSSHTAATGEIFLAVIVEHPLTCQHLQNSGIISSHWQLAPTLAGITSVTMPLEHIAPRSSWSIIRYCFVPFFPPLAEWALGCLEILWLKRRALKHYNLAWPGHLKIWGSSIIQILHCLKVQIHCHRFVLASWKFV